ncbi:riboflavin kinase [Exaiptasia diaphana]|uniref:Riboflavin kinase n=1 Tax=Exaiptasia diaphana TaxID=2652724 RepID=A0A913X989_EXADI|nr:riboflavin kinase [Exaiptasia diaphana]KXJ14329.1 Riboflavin kinase [Exaiptasia diaphana]
MEMHDEISNKLPIFVQGSVVKGFGRGSKELGIPTANYPEDVVDKCSESLKTGIYCGWSRVDDGEVYKMVMSVGWNPYYKNEKKSMETHIIHNYDQDFYGSQLSVIVVGYLRPEKSYPSLQALIDAIHDDINQAKDLLERPENKAYASHTFFTSSSSSNAVQNGL